MTIVLSVIGTSALIYGLEDETSISGEEPKYFSKTLHVVDVTI